ncbi:MAG: hypothetical protein ABI416_17990 [Ginsengibacter sp.]
MNYLFFATSISLIVSFASCNSNKSDAANNKSEPSAQSASSSSSQGGAVFSYNLDGTKISGGGVDALMMNNVAALSKSDGNPDKLTFFLNDVNKENTETFSHSLRFQIPGTTGTVALTPGEDHWHVELFLTTAEEGKYVVYGNEAFNITVTNVTSTHVSGTFSGNVKLAKSTGAGINKFTVTNGKFDIPVKSDAY